MRTYAVKETFRTIQGEGYHTGTPALFVRFAGCNLWSGREQDRERDAVASEAECPRFCDTDFVGGERMTAEEIGAVVAEAGLRLVVLSGGEPLLQVDDALLAELHRVAPQATIAIETNGTVWPKFRYRPAAHALLDAGQMADRDLYEVVYWLWITLSPKRSRSETKIDSASEIKLVVPAYKAADWADFPADHYFLQPQALQDRRDVDNEQSVANILSHFGGKWRLSLQTHKILGVR